MNGVIGITESEWAGAEKWVLTNQLDTPLPELLAFVFGGDLFVVFEVEAVGNVDDLFGAEVIYSCEN